MPPKLDTAGPCSSKLDTEPPDLIMRHLIQECRLQKDLVHEHQVQLNLIQDTQAQENLIHDYLVHDSQFQGHQDQVNL